MASKTPRKQAARRVRQATTRGAAPQAPAAAAERGLDGPATAGAMAPEQRAATMAWFDAYRDLLNGQIDAIEESLDDAHPDDRDGLLLLKSGLEDRRTRLAQQQEAFFVQGTLALKPPGSALIQRTKDLAAQMDALIRAQKRAQAVTALAGQLAELVQKVGVSA